MIIAHNMQSSFTNRQLGINTKAKGDAAEKLSSGYRINRAADDAAGLSISEKMRAQIRGLDQASVNAQDAVSLIQTADGALNEVHSILHRIEELTVQAANDTNISDDREAIQQEINLLLDEVDRISESTEFNTRAVLKMPQLIELDGSSLGTQSLDKQYEIQTDGGTTKDVYGIAMDFGNIDENNIAELIGKSFSTTCTQNCAQVFTFDFTADTTSTATISGNNMSVKIGVNNNTLKNGGDVIDEIINAVRAKQGDAPFDGYDKSDGHLYIGHANGITKAGDKLYFYAIPPTAPPYADGMGLLNAADMIVESGNINFQVGANSNDFIEYTIKTVNTATLGIRPMDVSTHEKAGDAVTAAQAAVVAVSDYRAYMGAMQNRLEHTMSIDDNASENLQASESRIRDVDMADEMVNYSKQNILEQAAQAMLVQANQSKQGVLSLLQK